MPAAASSAQPATGDLNLRPPGPDVGLLRPIQADTSGGTFY